MSQVWLSDDTVCGFGRALADAVLRTGCRVFAGSREPGRLALLSGRSSARVRVVGFDAADEASVYAAVNAGLAAFGRIDVVVNNAGEAGAAPVAEMTDTDLRARFETDFFHTVGVLHAVLPVLREQGAGRFVQIVAADAGFVPGTAAHRAAQGAIRSYFAALAEEAAAAGVALDLVEPGEMLAGAIERASACPSRVEGNAAAVSKHAQILKFPVRPEAA